MHRPTSVVVFGILNILFGAFGLLGILMNVVFQSLPVEARQDNEILMLIEENQFYSAWYKVSTVLGGLASVVVVVAGIGLLAMRRWARVAAVWYGYYGLAMGIIGTLFAVVILAPSILSFVNESTDVEVAIAGVVGLVSGIVGGLAGLIYHGLLVYFMTRSHVVAAFRGEAPGDNSGFESSSEAAPVTLAESVDDGTSPNPYRSPTAVAHDGTDAPPDAVETLIPYRNGAALAAYYLGVFSIFACVPLLGLLGVLMAIFAVILGIKGLRFSKENPQARGRIHAWIGVIGGIVCGLVGLLINAAIAVSLFASLSR